MKLLTTAKTINTKIDSIKTRGAKLDSDIHLTAVSCIAHAEKHGDVTLATRLIQAMPKSGRTKTLREWFNKYSPLHWSTKEDAFRLIKGDFQIDEAFANPFWSEKEVTKADFDMLKYSTQVAKRIEREAKAGKVHKGDMLAFITAMKAMQKTIEEQETTINDVESMIENAA